MNKPVIIFGIGPFAEMIYTMSEAMPDFRIEAFMADDDYCKEDTFCELPLKKYSELDETMTEKYDFLLCIGYKKMRSRKIVFDKLMQKGCRFTNFIYPTVNILPKVTLGINNIILSDVTIESNAKIGDNNIFWTKTVVGHNDTIGSHNFFAANVTLAGNLTLGDLCFFGVAVFTIDGLTIRDETYLVAGSGLFTNTKKCTRYWGYNMAKKISTHEEKGIEI
jgi:sugar O-acyltransferase (sialic acid O-acetyltransferase NeuD family)